MEVHLIIGGACSGKRKFVKSKWNDAAWVSSYEGQQLSHTLGVNNSKTPLVLEGFENWIMKEIKLKRDHYDIRESYRLHLKNLLDLDREVIIIMLEIGRGIVPISEQERKLRDVLGWIQQDTAALCEEVYYLWHGMAKKMK